MEKIIKVTSGKGEGLTELAAFDAALQDAGISNYILIYLSSIIPPGFEAKVEKPTPNDKEFGHRLYVVMAQESTDKKRSEAWAGLGWVMQESGRGGLFVEHHGKSESEVVKLITDSLNSMKSHRKEKYGEIKYEVAGIECKDKPVCALVAAVYQSEGWK